MQSSRLVVRFSDVNGCIVEMWLIVAMVRAASSCAALRCPGGLLIHLVLIHLSYVVGRITSTIDRPSPHTGCDLTTTDGPSLCCDDSLLVVVGASPIDELALPLDETSCTEGGTAGLGIPFITAAAYPGIGFSLVEAVALEDIVVAVEAASEKALCDFGSSSSFDPSSSFEPLPADWSSSSRTTSVSSETLRLFAFKADVSHSTLPL